MVQSKKFRRLASDVAWLSDAPIPAVIASVRLTALLPAGLLGGRVLQVPADVEPESFLDRYGPQVIIVGKPVLDDRQVRVAEAGRKRGLRVVTAFCDWYFGDDHTSTLFRRQINASTDVVVQTEPMAEEFGKYYERKVAIIEEPFEYPRGTPKFQPALPVIRVLWYGGFSNYGTIPSAIHQLGRLSHFKIDLTLMSDKMPAIDRDFPGGFPENVNVRWMPWSLINQYNFMHDCDVIVVPSENTPSKRVKGHNRVVEGINAGRLVVAYPLPQYAELSDYIFLDDNMASGLVRALADPQSVIKRLLAGQKYIDSRFAPEVVAEKWRALLDGPATT